MLLRELCLNPRGVKEKAGLAGASRLVWSFSAFAESAGMGKMFIK